jgi:hypothetical protein
VSHGADAPYEDTAAAMTLKYARDVALKGVEIHWDEPHAATWQSGLVADQVSDLVLADVTIDPAPASAGPLVRLNDADGVTIRQSQIASVEVTGSKTKAVRLSETDSQVTMGPGVAPDAVKNRTGGGPGM